MLLLKLNKIKTIRDSYHDEVEDSWGDPVEAPPPVVSETTTPTALNAEAIKTYYPRKGGKVGTRINLLSGRGFAVAETPDELEEMLSEGGVRIKGEWRTAEVAALTYSSETEGGMV